MVQSRSVTDNFYKLIKSHPSLCVSISTYFLYFGQFPKFSFNKVTDFSRILSLFTATAYLPEVGSFGSFNMPETPLFLPD